MYAMALSARGAPLRFQERPDPIPGPGEVRIKVSACGVVRTDLHVVDGELPDISYPIVPGHEVVGRIDAIGAGVGGLAPDMRAGVPWLGWTCGHCAYCEDGRENLCDRPQFTGYTRDGAFATQLLADARYCFPLALRAVRKGGRVVCAGIHMSDIPAFPYSILWQERQLVSVANLTRQDGLDFLKVATRANIRTHTTEFPLARANEALAQLREGKLAR